MGPDDSLDVDEAVESRPSIQRARPDDERRYGNGRIVNATASLVFPINVVSLYGLIDDVRLIVIGYPFRVLRNSSPHVE
jgi:hypothetical protein